ncbi:Myoneurin [Pseudolycoriella hygida]|uniref:Myoneurin n=1 Tax=Pseudolycoriella hygida TaxID=35572 RepID=A0A9Q0MIP7_9DIPT|nr:Myoneurin [Pseudolycoriella hygida]
MQMCRVVSFISKNKTLLWFLDSSPNRKFKKLKNCIKMNVNVCRICTISSESFEYSSLMEKRIFKNIRLCDAFTLTTGLDISDEDDFPKLVCSRCEYQLENAFHLRQLAESSSRHFAAIRSNNQPRILNSLKSVSISEEFRPKESANLTLKSEMSENSSTSPEVYMVNLNVGNGDIEVKPRKHQLQTSLPMDTDFEYGVGDDEEDDHTDAISFLLNNKHIKKKDEAAYQNRKYECSVCSKRFIGKSNLLDHLRYHANIRNFKCDLCGKTFVQISSLKSHLRIHTDEKPYICSYCGKGFAQKSALTVHIRTHTQERNYVCEKCTKAFMTMGDLAKHKLSHEPIKKFSCDICGMRSAQKVNVKKHKKNVHGISEDQVKLL